MISDFKRYYRRMRLKAAENNMNAEEPVVPVPIPRSAAEVKAKLEETFSHSFDVKIRVFDCNVVVVAFIDGLVDKLLIEEAVSKPLAQRMEEIKNGGPEKKTVSYLQKILPSMCELKITDDFNECVIGMMSGDTLIFIDGDDKALHIGLQKWAKRAVEDPKTDTVVRGPREGFTETLNDNTAMLRRKIKDSNLVYEIFRIGRQTKTNVVLCYLKGTANQGIIDEARKRLTNIKTGEMEGSGFIEEYIEDSPFSLFPTVYNTERPDTVAGKLLKGCVAILIDGTPFALTVPNLFIDYLHNSEDCTHRWMYSLLMRSIRLLAFFISTIGPAFYIAVLCFHQDVIPFNLMITVTQAEGGIPFPPFIEMLLLVVTFELIKESGIRMPRALGQTVSIVGALIIGEAAVQAGLVSIPGVIAIAVTGISGYIIDKLDTTMVIIRVALMVAANILGLLGVSLVGIGIFAYACSLKSFGVPYMSPITPLSGHDFKNVFVRMPIWAMLQKPETITRKYIQNVNDED